MSTHGSTYGYWFIGENTGTTVKGTKFNTGFPVANRSLLAVGATPFIPLPGLSKPVPTDTSIVTGGIFSNGWAASAYSVSGTQSTCIVEESGMITLSIRVSAATATGTTIFTLMDGVRPANLESFIFTELSTGASFHGRILPTGEVQSIPNIPPATNTALYARITYSTP